jgi:hypothetical protein
MAVIKIVPFPGPKGNDGTGGGTGLEGVTTQSWGYPTEASKAIRPLLAGEAIALKSSQSAALRWHVRENSPSVVIARLTPSAAVVTPTGDGDYYVDFTINTQDYAPTTSEHYYYVEAPESSDYTGNFLPVSSTTTSLRLRYPSDPGTFNSTNASIAQPSVYSQFEVREDGAYVKIANWTDGPGGYSQTWHFTNDGAIHFPYGPSNNRTGSGDVLRFAQSFDQAIITGAPATESNPNANRLVIAGQDGSSGNGSDGEGGDIYVWAGQGGGTNGDGGDIKIDGGQGQGTGQGGYVKVRGGYSPNGNGGFVNINSGSSATLNGGDINIDAGEAINGENTSGGTVNITAGNSNTTNFGGNINLSTYQGGKITLNSSGEIIAGNILRPSTDNNVSLGTSGYRWNSLYLGPGTLNITDSVLNTNAAISIADGVFNIDGIVQAQLPDVKVINLTFNDDTIQTTAYVPSEGITLYSHAILSDGSDNTVLRLIEDGGIGKIYFGGGTNGIWQDSGKTYITGVGYHSADSGIKPMYYNSATGEVTYNSDAIKSIYPKINVYWTEPYVAELTHAGSLIYAATVDDTPAHYVIPTNEATAFPVGSEIKLATNGACALYVEAADTATTTLVGEGSNGYTGENWTFILPANSTGTLLKVDTDRWILSGLRLTD